MLRLPGAWTWDFWLADDGDRYHVFFLFASRALQDERRRHRRAGIGHAVSDDLRNWFRVSDALASSDEPAFDDVATWTGSVVQGPDGRWWLFYTGVTEVNGKPLQTTGAATSSDLEVWHKEPASPLVTADARWYERLGATPGTRKLDEIIISTLPAPISRWLGMDLPHRLQRHSGLPVTTMTTRA